MIRFRQCITVTDAQGERRTATEWVPKAGHLRKLPKALVTADSTPVGAVVCEKKKGMKEPWCLATRLEQASAAEVVALYSHRFSIGEGVRNLKDLRFGMGLSWVRIAEPERRDRLLLSALACALLTLLGAAGESLGMERYLKANTVKRRTYSLFRQGCTYYQSVPNMPEHRLLPLVEHFAQLVCAQSVFRESFGLLWGDASDPRPHGCRSTTQTSCGGLTHESITRDSGRTQGASSSAGMRDAQGRAFASSCSAMSSMFPSSSSTEPYRPMLRRRAC